MDLKLIYIVFFGGVFGCFSQKDSLQNPYFKSYNDKITASIYYLDTSNSFQIASDAQNTETFVSLIPNRREQIGFNLNYRIIDVSVGFAPKFLGGNKGDSNSKHFNFNTRFYYKKWMQSFTFINQKGFYISDDNITAQLPNMRTTKIGGTTAYVFNDKFSFKTLVSQNEWQTKSSGSFIPTFSFYYTNIDLNTPDSTPGDIYVFTLAPSYFYNFVISDRVLIGAGLALGVGINDINGDSSALYQADFNLKLAYNNDRFFAFASINTTGFAQDEKITPRLNDNIATLKISAGYRFDPPKKVKEVYDKVNQKIGL
ncbi:uncharacterized protein DUF4421 [Flavobacterium sp. 90]|uniref:DUF4421 family protein n=1 Tax=unclassified Flavobacterium TaxID=196869 RepID=UPI000EB57970|nr:MULTISPECIES: DUF4421 family protein [unclassified Flavobacterium]RKR10295.1 uncharacterized protein DUF4421 [Flavobacterium sp. 81]TCK54080.1 uncharacterized protein DUF4421 [Flavobacterium sp. 90]